MNTISVFWFRRDLRLHDNHGLYQALRSGNPVVCIFIFDKNILGALNDKDDRRVSFIHEAIRKLNSGLAMHHCSLRTLHDTPENAFLQLIRDFHVSDVYTNHDYEPYAISRDEMIKKLLSQKGISFHSYKDQVIFEKAEIIKNDGAPYSIFTPYSRAWKQKLITEPLQTFQSEGWLNELFPIQNPPLHTLSQLGFNDVLSNFPADKPDPDIIAHYDETRNIPSLKGTSRLGVHLRFGTVSIRDWVTRAKELNEQWLNELIWREFFMMILFHFPHVVTQSFKKKYDRIEWRNNEHEFKAWCLGETGYPLVDAGMRELNETGFMHNRVRMVVASFLTKHLLIDWRWGEAYFAEKLLDYELSSNIGNWQWAAGCGCDAAPYFRIFNPYEQARKFDPEEIYIHTWIKDYKPGYLEPIVEHDFARKRALEVYKKAVNEE